MKSGMGKISKMDRMRHLYWSHHSLHGSIIDICTVAIAFLFLHPPDSFQNNKTLGRARDPRANGAWLNKLIECIIKKKICHGVKQCAKICAIGEQNVIN